MKPFTKILVAHDFSDHAQRAVDVATDLARRYAAKLSIVHVHQPVMYAAPDAFLLRPSNELEEVMTAVGKKLEEIAGSVRGDGTLQIDTKLLQGAPVQEIGRLAADGGYDLIVMGTHGRTGVAHALIGSVAERVVRTAACPVLTVRLPG
jgi:nucleotide-binding universal stress UspA family protein